MTVEEQGEQALSHAQRVILEAGNAAQARLDEAEAQARAIVSAAHSQAQGIIARASESAMSTYAAAAAQTGDVFYQAAAGAARHVQEVAQRVEAMERHVTHLVAVFAKAVEQAQGQQPAGSPMVGLLRDLVQGIKELR
jgi:hypothetical protein